jgi:hypothetical protein
MSMHCMLPGHLWVTPAETLDEGRTSSWRHGRRFVQQLRNIVRVVRDGEVPVTPRPHLRRAPRRICASMGDITPAPAQHTRERLRPLAGGVSW